MRLRFRLVPLALVALTFAGTAAAQSNAREWDVWMGPQFVTSQSLGAFRGASPHVGFGPGFALTLRHEPQRVAARFDIGLVSHDGRKETALTDDGFGGLESHELRPQTRLSWAAIGVQYERPWGDGANYAFASVGVGGTRTEVDAFNQAAGYDPPGRPESNRGLAWAVGAGMRRRFGRARTAAWTVELDWRRRENARYVGVPAFGTDANGSWYNTAESEITTASLRLGLMFTRP